MEHLFDKLKNYSKSGIYPLHMPGHKRNECGALPYEIYSRDITEIDGFDNLHQPEEILQKLQEKAAGLYGADETFYLINGSTSGILSAISAALPKRGHLLMTRASHKSAYHAAYLRELQVTYLYPSVMEEFGICEAVTAKQIESVLSKDGTIDAVFVVSPTYEGRISNIKKIAEVVHKFGIPLIVDEAHGAHLGFSEFVHENSCRSGADLVIHSVHKTLPAMTQTALLHVNGDLIDRTRLRRFLSIYQSSSPSYLLMASIDNALTYLENNANQIFYDFSVNYLKMMEKLKECNHLRFLNPDFERQDLGKLLISVRNTNLDGIRLHDILLHDYKLQVEMAGQDFVLAMFTVNDREEAYVRVTNALLDIDKKLSKAEVDQPAPYNFYTLRKGSTIGCSLWRAWDMKTKTINLVNAHGRLAATFINIYPPGIPLLVPGEKISDGLPERLISLLDLGLNVQGIDIRNDSNGNRQCLISVIDECELD